MKGIIVVKDGNLYIAWAPSLVAHTDLMPGPGDRIESQKILEYLWPCNSREEYLIGAEVSWAGGYSVKDPNDISLCPWKPLRFIQCSEKNLVVTEDIPKPLMGKRPRYIKKECAWCIQDYRIDSKYSNPYWKKYWHRVEITEWDESLKTPVAWKLL